MPSVRHRLPPDVLRLVTVIFWSFNFTAAKYALTHGFAPLVYSAFRFGIGAPALPARCRPVFACAPHHLASQDWTAPPARGWWAGLYARVFPVAVTKIP